MIAEIRFDGEKCIALKDNKQYNIGHHVDSTGGSKYMLTFTDDYTRCITVYFITSKAEVLSRHQDRFTGKEVENFSRKERDLKLKSDNGGEYSSHESARFCKDRGFLVNSHVFIHLSKMVFLKG